MIRTSTSTRAGLVLLSVGLLGAAAVTTDFDSLRDLNPFVPPDECTATVDGTTVTLDPEQAENAALIAAVAVRRGLPARAVTIALATAYQESQIANLPYGDADSLGIFQQRPSQGWGSEQEVLNPIHAINAFYDALEKVDGYLTMPVTEAAQEVQRSAFPGAYADHEADARVLASALTGHSPAAFSCRVDPDAEAAPDRLRPSGLVRRADVVRRNVQAAFGDVPLGGFEPGGVSAGHMKGSAHYEGRAIDIFVRPINRANKTRGWAIAEYLVANADRLDIQTVIFDAKIWSARHSGAGWRNYDPGDGPGDRAILEHRDHVHVDVFD